MLVQHNQLVVKKNVSKQVASTQLLMFDVFFSIAPLFSVRMFPGNFLLHCLQCKSPRFWDGWNERISICDWIQSGSLLELAIPDFSLKVLWHFFPCYSIMFIIIHYFLNPVVLGFNIFHLHHVLLAQLSVTKSNTHHCISKPWGTYSQGSTCEVSKSGANPRSGWICWWLGYLCLDPRGWWLVFMFVTSWF